MERPSRNFQPSSSNRKLQAIFASPNRYFTENSRWVLLPKLYDIFLGTTCLPSQEGRRFLLLSEFECPRTILIKQQHIFPIKKKLKKKITLDMVPSTLDMEPLTLDPRQKDRLMSKHALSPAGQLSGICQFFRKRYKCPTVGPGSSYKKSMVGLKKVCKFLACEQTSSILQISQKKSGEKMSVNRCRLPCSAKHLHKSFSFCFFL